MSDALTLLFGPLAGPECRRALGRGWVIVVRVLAAVATLAVTLAIVWWWWVAALADPGHTPYDELRVGLGFVLGMMVGGALLLGPAVMAGSIAGEKERGTLGLMLISRASPREIVAGRVAGKFSQVAMVVMAAAPAAVILGSLAGFGPAMLALAILLPLAVGFGGVGLAGLASCLSRRGRDALLAVYLGQVLVLAMAQVPAGL
ncbi:MAG: hypothetical protein K2X91_16145, partial [Thermoleophilia bacterium]|nr:hypothetical protein [Thermoleophilia bacterium]